MAKLGIFHLEIAKMSINLNELQKALQEMQPRTKLYELVRAELIKQGRWRNAPRGAHVKK